MFKHWNCKLNWVTEKFTNVTLDHISGVNYKFESLVIMKILNLD